MTRQLLLAALLISPALAQHSHPPEDMTIHEKFYSNWKRPDTPSLSCCSLKDCFPTEAKNIDGHWWAKSKWTGTWVQIPDEKVEQTRDNPDGRNHVCMTESDFPLCFIPGVAY